MKSFTHNVERIPHIYLLFRPRLQTRAAPNSRPQLLRLPIPTPPILLHHERILPPSRLDRVADFQLLDLVRPDDDHAEILSRDRIVQVGYCLAELVVLVRVLLSHGGAWWGVSPCPCGLLSALWLGGIFTWLRACLAFWGCSSRNVPSVPCPSSNPLASRPSFLPRSRSLGSSPRCSDHRRLQHQLQLQTHVPLSAIACQYP